MKKINSFAIIAILALGSLKAQAEIREIIQMKDIVSEITPETLLVFDLDNTLHEPTQSLGSDQWYGSIVKENINNGMTETSAIDAAIKLWIKVQLVTKVKTLEADTPQIISDLQSQRIRIFGLTARPVELIDPSLEQLKSLNIDLSKTSKLKDSFEIPAEDKVAVKGGVVFVGPKNNKGKVLKKLIELEGQSAYPQKIVFVDDKLKHVTNVQTSLDSLTIPYLGFRYGAADPQVNGLNPAITRIQLADFLKILSNEEAANLINE